MLFWYDFTVQRPPEHTELSGEALHSQLASGNVGSFSKGQIPSPSLALSSDHLISPD